MVRVKIKGAACGLYKVYTVVTTSHMHGTTALALAVIPQPGSYTIAGKLYHGRVQGVVYIVQATWTMALSWLFDCTLEAYI